jgi:gamma-D-glutamyl-L-lysine dipeptidyl-peptidase
MNNIFFFKHPLTNLYKSSSNKSEIVSQILYGEKFKILSKNKTWIKIKTSYDNYIGYIKNKYYEKKFLPTYKIYKIKTKIFKKPINKRKYETKSFLTFASKVQMIENHKGFIKYEKNKWIKKNDTKKITHEENDYFKILKIFLNTKYIWGGKSYKGIDCSAIIQLFFFYNNKFFPRDTKDQIKYLKSDIKRKIFKKGDIIFWKGHVAICVNNKKLIHAFGPRKKVIIANIQKTIIEIKKNSKLNIIGKKNINDY